ncbi:Cytoplasmic tRNA 2-thiolation protein 1 [Astathelohania contejeani]|uniref:Cytoplasmic tRNA 2-thiolation protein 1 n=1 Tax=Astathelohania contejeani TaxID=164912 RepID=A0ABQ7HVU5_9MICR|nr:Cytoplasmic tRNA 2-thiolation protein 1 [Thelohania contejeani]
MACQFCSINKAVVLRPKDKSKLCKECFFAHFESEIHSTIINSAMFKKGMRVAVCVSGGKDSTVLAHVLNLLNERYDYGIELVLLSVDEGITGYRDHALETVHANRGELPLKVVSFNELFGVTMDKIVELVGRRSNCTYCGVLRRKAMEIGANNMSLDAIATGHNADDMAETVLMNILRGDIGRLGRCTLATTDDASSIARCKPFKYTYQKEIVLYAFHKKLLYFSTECTYSPGSYRGQARTFLKEFGKFNSHVILDLIQSGESFETKKDCAIYTCYKCGQTTSSNLKICKGCVLLEGILK